MAVLVENKFKTNIPVFRFKRRPRLSILKKAVFKITVQEINTLRRCVRCHNNPYYAMLRLFGGDCVSNRREKARLFWKRRRQNVLFRNLPMLTKGIKHSKCRDRTSRFRVNNTITNSRITSRGKMAQWNFHALHYSRHSLITVKINHNVLHNVFAPFYFHNILSMANHSCPRNRSFR